MRRRSLMNGQSLGDGSVIYYTTSDKKVLSLHNTTGFDAPVIRNTYENGLGTLVFGGTLTRIGGSSSSNSPFYNTNVEVVILPDTITYLGSDVFYGSDIATVYVKSPTPPEILSTYTYNMGAGVVPTEYYSLYLADSTGEAYVENAAWGFQHIEDEELHGYSYNMEGVPYVIHFVVDGQSYPVVSPDGTAPTFLIAYQQAETSNISYHMGSCTWIANGMQCAFAIDVDEEIIDGKTYTYNANSGEPA